MTQYIDKSDLIVWIEKRQKEEVFYDEDGSFASWADQNHYSTLESIKNFINTLKVKEMDLEKELGKYLDANDIEFSHQIKLLDFAKYFFELGFKSTERRISYDTGR